MTHSLVRRPSFIVAAVAAYALMAVRCTSEELPSDGSGGVSGAGKGGGVSAGGTAPGSGGSGSAGGADSGGTAGLGGAAGDGFSAPECAGDEDCGVGQVCSGGYCVLEPCDPPAISFSYDGGSATSVALAGSFNGWDPSVTPLSDDDEDGIWTAEVEVAPGAHQYKFVLDGDTWVSDPENPDASDDGFGGENSLITVGCDGALPPTGGFGGASGEGGAGGSAGAAGQGGAGGSAGAAEQGGAGGDAGATGQGGDNGAAGAGGANTCDPGLTEFSLLDEDATSVTVAGSFNGWSSTAWPLSDDDDDNVWTGSFEIATGSYQYKFVIDTSTWITDPGNENQVSDGYGGWNSGLTVVCQ